MSLIFFDGFDQYELNVSGDYQKGPWSGGNPNSRLVTDFPRHTGYNSFNIANDSSAYVLSNFRGQSSTTLVVGHAHYWQSSGFFGQGFNQGLVKLFDNSVTPVAMVTLWSTTSHALRIEDSGGNNYYSTNVDVEVLSATEWYYIELRVISGAASVGVCEVYVNNVKWDFTDTGLARVTAACSVSSRVAMPIW